MPDTTFESLLSGQLRAYAEAGVRPIDRFAIAEETIASGRTVPRWRRGWGLAPTGGNRVLVALLVGLLLAALVGGALLVGARLLTPPPLQVPHTYRNEFVTLPDLSRPMEEPRVVPLVDGRVLVIGRGYDSGDAPTTAELYDPATGATNPLGPIATPGGFADWAVRLKDGRVLIMGDGSALMFDPMTMGFAAVGPVVTSGRTAAAAVLRDGRVLIAGPGTPGPGGERGLSAAELFDPDTLTFSATGSLGATEGPLLTLPDGRVFVAASGRDPAQVYDPTTGTFSAAGNTSSSFSVSHAIGLADGRVIVFGGGGGVTIHLYYTEVWDPTSRTFSTAIGDRGDGLGLHDQPSKVVSATLLDDGRIFLIGGQIGGRGPSWAGIYDPATGMTSSVDAPKAVSPSVARLADGRLVLVGGQTDVGTYVSPDGVGYTAPAVSTVQVFQ